MSRWATNISWQHATPHIGFNTNNLVRTFQKQPSEVFCKMVFSKFIKKGLQHRCFPVKLTKFLRAPFLRNICERLLLTFKEVSVYLFLKFIENEIDITQFGIKITFYNKSSFCKSFATRFQQNTPAHYQAISHTGN